MELHSRRTKKHTGKRVRQDYWGFSGDEEESEMNPFSVFAQYSVAWGSVLGTDFVLLEKNAANHGEN